MSDATLSPYRIIAIEGNIGVGKTTISTLLADRLGRQMLPERFHDNPFLASFYKDADRYGFSTELHFLMDRLKDWQDETLRNGAWITDHMFEKTMLFARQNLKQADELELFKRIYKNVALLIPQPDVIVFLHRPIHVLIEQIKKRGRSYEHRITTEYLSMLDTMYLNYLRDEHSGKRIILRLGDSNLLEEQAALDQMIDLLEQPLEDGLYVAEVKAPYQLVEMHSFF